MMNVTLVAIMISASEA